MRPQPPPCGRDHEHRSPKRKRTTPAAHEAFNTHYSTTTLFFNILHPHNRRAWKRSLPPEGWPLGNRRAPVLNHFPVDVESRWRDLLRYQKPQPGYHRELQSHAPAEGVQYLILVRFHCELQSHATVEGEQQYLNSCQVPPRTSESYNGRGGTVPYSCQVPPRTSKSYNGRGGTVP